MKPVRIHAPQWAALLIFTLGLSAGGHALSAETNTTASAMAVPTSKAEQSQALLEQVHAQLHPAPVLKGRFEQLKHVQGFKQPLRSSGEFVVAQSQGIVWHVEHPFASTLVMTPQSLQSRDADGALSLQMQASDEPVLRTVNAMLFAVMSANVAQLEQMFEVSGKAQPSGWALHLKPRDQLLAQWLQKIELQGQAFVQQVQLYEASGDHSEIRIRDVQGSGRLTDADAARFQ